MRSNARILQTENQITIKGHSLFSFIGGVAWLMSLVGVKLIASLLPFKDGGSFGDYFGLVFICVWMATLWGIGFVALVKGSKKMILNEQGVSSRTWVRYEFIAWADIKDYGLSYYGKAGRHQNIQNVYELYFARQVQKARNAYEKKLKGRMIKGDIIGKEYEDALMYIIPFCRQRTGMEPFVAEDKRRVWR